MIIKERTWGPQNIWISLTEGSTFVLSWLKCEQIIERTKSTSTCWAAFGYLHTSVGGVVDIFEIVGNRKCFDLFAKFSVMISGHLVVIEGCDVSIIFLQHLFQVTKELVHI